MDKLSIIIILSILHRLQPSSAACHPDDLSGLLDFKSGITSDPSGLLSTWKSATDCCTWDGITCNDNRVTVIMIDGSGIHGPIGFLAGKISTSISKLKFLTGIYLENLLKLSGPLPETLFDLPALQYMYIRNNALSGPIPASVRNLTKLYALSLSNNKLTGLIPSSISELTQLNQLELDGNQFSGAIPSSFRKLKRLRRMNLSMNKLSGPIPEIFKGLKKLSILNLTGNQLSGKIPSTISGLSIKLWYIELGHNELTGENLDYLGELKGIVSLDLSYNKFNLGKIPKWVAPCPVGSLKLARCGIKMDLEEFNPSFTSLYNFIDLSENDITGSPVKLLNGTDDLVGFWAAGNKLKFDLEKLKIGSKMQDLDLSRNLVYGKVPKNVTGLEKLNLSHNHLCGPLPTTSFAVDAFVGNDCLCGSPLPPCK